jgi:hypothetical protein
VSEQQPRTYDCKVWSCENRAETKWAACKPCQEPQKPHTCPFMEEIHNDSESLCTCSREGEYECAMDV